MYTIRKEYFCIIENKIENINKIANKLKTKQLKLKIIKEYMIEKEELSSKHIYKMINYEIIGNMPVISGYKFIASLEAIIDKNNVFIGNIIKKWNIDIDLSEYSNRSITCEHCNIDRYRKKAYLIIDKNNKIKMVGSTCLQNYTGYADINVYARFFDNFLNLHMECSNPDHDSYEYKDKIEYIETNPFLELVTAISRIDGGYISNKIAYDTNTISTTKYALNYYLDHKESKKIEVKDKDKIKVLNAINWIKNYSIDNDYYNNLKILVSQDYCKINNANILGSLINAYDNYINKSNENKNSEFIGKIGEKIEIKCKLIKKFAYDNGYGINKIYIFSDNNGNIIKWSTMKNLEEDNIILKGTIKEHIIYNDVKQTVLTRCKIIE